MNISTDLFELIKSLSKTEKRYLKLHTSLQKGSKIYLMLFEIIDKMDFYDEEKIKNKFQGEKFIKHLGFTKNYLYNSIIKSLIAFNNEKSIEQNLLDRLIKAKLLYNRSLYKQFFTALLKVKQLAKDYEKDYIYLEVLRMERQAIKISEHRPGGENNIYEEEEGILEKIRSIHGFFNFYINSDVIQTHGCVRIKDYHDELDCLLEKMNDKIKSKNLSVREKFYYLNICVNIAFSKGDMPGMLELARELLEIMECNPNPFKNDNSIELQHAYMDVMYSCLKLEKYDEFEYYFKIFRALKPKAVIDEANIFAHIHHLLLIKFMAQAEFESGLKLVNDINAGLEKYKGKMQRDDEIVLIYSLCRICLISGKFADALKYSNLLLNHPLIEIRSDIFCYVKILNLIIHYELGNYELIEYLIKSVYKFLAKRKKLYKFENLILSFIRKIPRKYSEEKFIESLVVLRKELIVLNKEPLERNVFYYFDFISWVESKIEGKSFGAIVKGKNKYRSEIVK